MIKPLIGDKKQVYMNSTMILDMGQSISEPLSNTQAFVEEYQLFVEPEYIASQLENYSGLQIGFFDSSKSSGIQVSNEPSVHVKEHWSMGTLHPSSPIYEHTNGVYREQRVIGMNRNSTVRLHYQYQFNNVASAEVMQLNMLHVPDVYQHLFKPDCECENFGCNCSLVVTNLFENIDALFFNMTMEFVFNYVLEPEATSVGFSGSASLLLENTALESTTSQASFFACDLKKFVCKIPFVSGTRVFFGVKKMNLVARQSSDPQADSLVTSETNPEITISVKPVIRKWLYWTVTITPIALSFLIFFCCWCCSYCCFACRPQKRKNEYSSRFSSVDTERLRLVDDRNSNLYRQ